MKNLLETLIDEGLLSDLEDNMKAGDKMSEEYILKQWFTNDKCKAWKQRKGWLLVGNFKINFEGEVYDGPKIKKVDGNLSIYKSGLVTLENIFTDDATITGSLTIEDNDNLISLKGLPTTINSVTIAGNKKLTDIDVMLNVNGNAYISKNGKKFSKKELSKKMNVSKNIFCSVEPYDVILESEALMEAFKAPQLKLIWDGIKAASQDVSKEERVSFNDITRIAWDKLDASNITELDAKDPKCEKLIRAYCQHKYNGIIVIMNAKGEPLKMFYNQNITIIHPKLREYSFSSWNRKLNKYNINHRRLKTSEVVSSLTEWDNYTGRNGEYNDFKSDSVLFIEIPEELRQEYREKYNNRIEAKKGAVALMRGKERNGKYVNDKSGVNWYGEEIDYRQIRYFQNIANENRERYAQAIVKIRAEKALMTDTFKTLKVRIDKAFDRYTNLLDKVLKNPKNYNQYDIEFLNKKISNTEDAYGTRYSNYSGLMQMLNVYTRLIISASKGSGSSNIKNEIKAIEQSISNKIVEVEDELSMLEAK